MPPLPRPEHWPPAWPFAPDNPPVRARSGMVASTDRYASRAGVEVLEAGGNAVDAAVAVSFALAVVNPEAGNVGGSGFLLLRAADGTEAALDYRGLAPATATPDMFLDAHGQIGDRAELGHLAVAVPGSVMGLWEAHERFGSLPWARLVEPALRLAEGFVVEERLVRSYLPHIVAGLRRFPASVAALLPGGVAPAVGDTFRQPDLARTLERIRDLGADGFYRGETADLLVAEMRRGGGILTHDDLAGYQARWREPLRFGYGDHTVLSMPPSSSGGVALAATCRMLAARGGVGGLAWHGAPHVYLLAETWRRVFADRNHYLADPDFVRQPLDVLTSPAYAAWRAAGIGERAGDPDEVKPGVEAWRASRERHTTHVSVVDGRGDAVSLTTTLNTWFGSKVVAQGTGVLLNNEMDDFTAAPGVPNHFGLVQGEANAIAPGKRMLSAMTPTIVLGPGGQLDTVVGTPGGATIITTVFQVISNLLDHGMSLAEAVAAPRVHHQHRPHLIHVEPGGLPADVTEALREKGHAVVERTEFSGDVQAVRVLADGVLEGVADPRRGGVALGL